MKAFRKFVDVVNTISLYVSVVLLLAVLVSSVLQVFTRTVLNDAMVGTEEVARYSFIWVSFLGSSLAISKIGTHPTVDILNNALKGKAKYGHLIFTHIVMMLFGFVLLIHGGRLVTMVLEQLSPTLRIPMSAVYGACPVGGVGIILNSIAKIFEMIELLGETPEEEAKEVKEAEEGGAAS